jgi:uncharacterized protein
MILADVNVLIYAHRADAERHAAYASWLTGVAEGVEPFGLTTATVAGFVRVATNPRIFVEPSTIDLALAFVEALTESPMARWVEADERWWPVFAVVCRGSGARGNVVPDAQLAALAIEHGCRLATADRGFGRFPGLTWFHPLDAS